MRKPRAATRRPRPPSPPPSSEYFFECSRHFSRIGDASRAFHRLADEETHESRLAPPVRLRLLRHLPRDCRAQPFQRAVVVVARRPAAVRVSGARRLAGKSRAIISGHSRASPLAAAAAADFAILAVSSPAATRAKSSPAFRARARGKTRQRTAATVHPRAFRRARELTRDEVGDVRRAYFSRVECRHRHFRPEHRALSLAARLLRPRARRRSARS